MKNRIRTLRTERGWTQADLAAHLDVSRNSVNAIENGSTTPRSRWPSRSPNCSACRSRRSSRTIERRRLSAS